MADTKISALPAGTAPTGVEVFPAVQSGATVKLTVNQMNLFANVAPNYISNAYYYLHPNPTVISGQVWSNAGNIAFTPIILPVPVTFKAFAIRVATLGAGNAAVGIYANNPATNKPTGLPLAQVAGLSTATATTVSATLASPVSFAPGIYWVAIQLDNTTAVLTCPGNNTTGFNGFAVGGTLSEVSVSATAAGIQHYVNNGTYPTLGDQTATSWGAGANGNRCGALFAQVN